MVALIGPERFSGSPAHDAINATVIIPRASESSLQREDARVGTGSAIRAGAVSVIGAAVVRIIAVPIRIRIRVTPIRIAQAPKRKTEPAEKEEIVVVVMTT